MGGATSEQTETNAVLASGLAIVGLLGVAASLLPPDMLPGIAGQSGDQVQPAAEVVEVVEAAEVQSTPAPPVLPETPVRKSVEPINIVVAEPVISKRQLPEMPPAGIEPAPAQSAANVVSAVLDASSKAVSGSVESMNAGVEKLAPATPGEPTVATETAPVSASTPAKAEPVQPQSTVNSRRFQAPPMPHPNPWGNWQPPAYPQPAYPQPYMPYPQWNYPPQGNR